MKYRKKPVVIEAWQWGSGAVPVDILAQIDFGKEGAVIPTLEGEMKIRQGDYIIQGIKGELYPCKPDIFEATYEPV